MQNLALQVAEEVCVPHTDHWIKVVQRRTRAGLHHPWPGKGWLLGPVRGLVLATWVGYLGARAGPAGYFGARAGPDAGYLGWLLGCPCGAWCWLLGLATWVPVRGLVLLATWLLGCALVLVTWVCVLLASWCYLSWLLGCRHTNCLGQHEAHSEEPFTVSHRFCVSTPCLINETAFLASE